MKKNWKRLVCLMLACLWLVPLTGAVAQGDFWICRGCGRCVEGNFCSYCGTPSSAGLSVDEPLQGYRGVYATLTRRLATRSGPGTAYTEPGSFFQGGETVLALSRVYDTNNEIYWVQVEFTAEGKKMRAYTGAQRVNVNVNQLQDERKLISGILILQNPDDSRMGPGYDYAASPIYGAAQRALADVYMAENGWLQVEFYDASQGAYRRTWVPADAFTDRIDKVLK